MRRIGVIGGTFDPPHLGHILPVVEAAAEFRLDSVLFVPNFLPPHKSRPFLTDPFHRAAMVALAIQPYPFFLLNTLELNKGKVCFTFDTVQELLHELPAEDRLYFVLGSDSFIEFDSWYRYQELIDLCDFIIISRGHSIEELKLNLERLENVQKRELQNTFHFSRAPHIPVSSTSVRIALQESQPVAGMVPEEVEAYIRKHQLYQTEVTK